MKSFIKVFEVSVTLSELKARPFYQEINKRVRQGANIVIIDLTKVDFMDSAGLGVLVQIHKRVHSSGGKFCLSSISEKVKMLFELTSLDSVFEIIENRAESDKLFSQTSPKAEEVEEYANAILP